MFSQQNRNRADSPPLRGLDEDDQAAVPEAPLEALLLGGWWLTIWEKCETREEYENIIEQTRIPAQVTPPARAFLESCLLDEPKEIEETLQTLRPLAQQHHGYLASTPLKQLTLIGDGNRDEDVRFRLMRICATSNDMLPFLQFLGKHQQAYLERNPQSSEKTYSNMLPICVRRDAISILSHIFPRLPVVHTHQNVHGQYVSWMYHLPEYLRQILVHRIRQGRLDVAELLCRVYPRTLTVVVGEAAAGRQCLLVEQLFKLYPPHESEELWAKQKESFVAAAFRQGSQIDKKMVGYLKDHLPRSVTGELRHMRHFKYLYKEQPRFHELLLLLFDELVD